MDKKWCVKKEEAMKKQFYASKEKAIQLLEKLLDDPVAKNKKDAGEVARILNGVKSATYGEDIYICHVYLSVSVDLYKIDRKIYQDREDRYGENSREEWEEWARLVEEAVEAIKGIMGANGDVQAVFGNVEEEVCGDIIITDPCYLESLREGHNDDRDYTDVENLLYRDTMYGDWSCHTFDDKGNVLGEFCADAGMVCVAPLKNVLEYNPKFNYHITKPWTTTWIKDFKGKVGIYVEEEKDYPGEFFVYVAGEGVDVKTEVPIKFKTGQTGF